MKSRQIASIYTLEPPGKPQVELAKDARAMALKHRIGHRMAKVAFAAAIAGACLVSASFTYAASLKQDLNEQAAPAPTFTNPATPQAVVPQAATAGRPQPASQGRTVKPSTSLPQATPAETAAVVNKLLAPRQSDPNVPLPKENLAEAPSENTSLRGPKVYGRNESENGVLGAILGLRIPIPADRGASSASSTSSGASDR